MEASEWAPLLGDMPYAERVKLVNSLNKSIDTERRTAISLAVQFMKDALVDCRVDVEDVLHALWESTEEPRVRDKVGEILSMIALCEAEKEVA